MTTCTHCGRPITGRQVFIEHDLQAPFCQQCIHFFGGCPTCVRADVCDFETNPSPLPKQVAQVIQQGNMTMQTIVRNPEREEITCKKCPCYHEEWGCCRTQEFMERCITNHWEWSKEEKQE